MPRTSSREAAFLKTCLVTTAWLLAQGASAAIVVDPLSTGATDVSFGAYPMFPPYAVISNPVPDPLVAPTNNGLLVVGNASAGWLEINAGSQANVQGVWIGVLGGGPGQLTVTGPTSKLTSPGGISIGPNNFGAIDILDGATVAPARSTFVRACRVRQAAC